MTMKIQNGRKKAKKFMKRYEIFTLAIPLAFMYAYLSHQISCNGTKWPLAIIWNKFIALLNSPRNLAVHIAICVYLSKFAIIFSLKELLFDFYLSYYELFCIFDVHLGTVYRRNVPDINIMPLL